MGTFRVNNSKEWEKYNRAQKALQINNENDAGHFIRNILEDAITASALPLELSGEVSISSNYRTDFLVLRGASGLPVGVFEVKKPDSSNLEDSPKIFGELFDYMMFLKSTYNLATIVGVLTRYSDWYVCSLDPFSSSSSSSLSSPPRDMNDIEPVTPVVPRPSKPTKKDSPPRSPAQSKGHNVFQQPTKKTQGGEHNPVPAPRKLFVSQKFVFDDPELWRMLISVFSRMYSTHGGAESGVYRYVAEVGASFCGFRWRSINPGVRLADMDFTGFPHGNTTEFYVWENLGCGVSGRAFLVSSKSIAPPVVGVIKCFFSGRKGSKEVKRKARLQARDDEFDRWKAVYKNKYKYRKVTVFDRPAILLQFFSFISGELRRKLMIKVAGDS